MGQQEVGNIIQGLQIGQQRKDRDYQRQMDQAKLDAEIEVHRGTLEQRKKEFDATNSLAVKAASLLGAKFNLEQIKAQHELAKSASMGAPTPGMRKMFYTGPDDSNSTTIPQPEAGSGVPADTQVPDVNNGQPLLRPAPQQQQSTPNQVPTLGARASQFITNSANTQFQYSHPDLLNAEGKQLAPVYWSGSPQDLAQQEADITRTLNAPKDEAATTLAHQKNIETFQNKVVEWQVRSDIADAQMKNAREIADSKNITKLKSDATHAATARMLAELKKTNVNSEVSGDVINRVATGRMSSIEFDKMFGTNADRAAARQVLQKNGVAILDDKKIDMLGQLDSIVYILPDVENLNKVINDNPMTSLIPGTDAYAQKKTLVDNIQMIQNRVAKIVSASVGTQSDKDVELVKGGLIPSASPLSSNPVERAKHTIKFANSLENVMRATLSKQSKEQQNRILQDRGFFDIKHSILESANKVLQGNKTGGDGGATPTGGAVPAAPGTNVRAWQDIPQ